MTSKRFMLARLSLGVLTLCGCSTIMGYEERGIRKGGASGADGAGVNSASIAGNSGAFNESIGGSSSAAHSSSLVRNTAGGGLATSVAPGLGGVPVSPASSLGGALGTTTGVVATGGIVATGGSTTAGSAPVGLTTGGNAPVATAKGGNAPVAKGGNAPVGPTTGGNAPVTTGGTAPVGSTRGGAASVGSTTGGVAPAGGSTTTARTNCSAANVFCDGFEQGTNAELEQATKKAEGGKSWTTNGLGNIKSSGLGFVELSAGAGFNSDKALGIHFSGIPKERGGWLAKDLVNDLGLSESGTVRIDFDFYYVQSDYSGISFYPFSLICGASDYHLSFNLDVNKITEKGGSIPSTEEKHTETTESINWTEENIFFETWKHLGLVLNRSTGTVSMTVGGASILDPPALTLTGYLPGPSCSFAIGVMYAGNGDPISFDAYFDNVRIEVN